MAIDGRNVVPDGPDTEVGPQVLVVNEKRPNSIALHESHVLWTTDPPLELGKGEVVYLAPDQTFGVLSNNEDHPSALAVAQTPNGPVAFWSAMTGLGKLKQIPIFGTTPATTIDVGDVVYSIAADGDSVFYGTRFRVFKKGTASTAMPTEIAGGYGNGVTAITADANGVVLGARLLAGGWIIGAVSRNGGTVTTLGTAPDSAPAIRDVAIVGGDVYWLDRTMLKKAPRASGAETIVRTFPSTDRPWAMTASGTKLFIATNQGVLNPTGATGHIVELDTVTTTFRDLAEGQAEPFDVAADATHVYWVNRGLTATTGQIMRVAR